MKTRVTKEQIVAEIKRIAAKHSGQPPGIRSFGTESGLSKSSWEGMYWSKWSDALAEAGFMPNQRNQKFEDDEIFELLVSACRHYGRRPSLADMRLFRRSVNSDFPATAIQKRFGIDQLWQSFFDWLTEQPGKFDDVVAMLGEIRSSRIDEGSDSETGKSIADGYVYLLKSGDHYKIGKSEDIERRVKEVRTQMPESLVLVHTIRTDDASGIERYWHQRFQNQRANGEWFKLSRADISAFKRRSFQ